MVELADDQQPQPYDIRTLWHNSFDDILGNGADELRAAAVDALRDGPPDKVRTSGLAVVASVARAASCATRRRSSGWKLNRPFDGLVTAPGSSRSATRRSPSSRRTPAQVAKLHEAWERWLTHHQDVAGVAAYRQLGLQPLEHRRAGRGGRQADAAVRRRPRRPCARGLEDAGLADGGVSQLDVLKLPHHGSIRNVEKNFFERLPARHYVISADGRNGNPETETLKMIAATRADDDFEIHFTNHDGENRLARRLDAFVKSRDTAGRKFRISFRDPAALGLRIDLADPLEGA